MWYIYIYPVYPHDVPVTGSFIPCFYWLNALIFRIDNKYIIIYYNHIHPYPHDITIHHGCLCSVSIDYVHIDIHCGYIKILEGPQYHAMFLSTHWILQYTYIK